MEVRVFFRAEKAWAADRKGQRLFWGQKKNLKFRSPRKKDGVTGCQKTGKYMMLFCG
jgi:hypothetical protein